MGTKLSRKSRIVITAGVSLLLWGTLLWDHFHGGIPTHYILHDDSLPGIPNWVGGLILPFFTWFLLYRIHKRTEGQEPVPASDTLGAVLRRFWVAFAIAVSISIFFSLQIDVIDYIMLAIFALALVYPLYKAEYLLGWVLGSTLTFGAMIPMVFGSVLALVFYILYQIVTFIRSRLGLAK